MKKLKLLRIEEWMRKCRKCHRAILMLKKSRKWKLDQNRQQVISVGGPDLVADRLKGDALEATHQISGEVEEEGEPNKQIYWRLCLSIDKFYDSRFFRRSRSQDRFRGRFRERSRDRDRFYGRRSRSRSRGRRFDRRNRRSNSRKSLSPPPPPAPQYQQQAPPPPMYSDPNYAAYPGYLPQNSFPYDYPGAYPPPAPAFIPQAPAAPNMILPGPPGRGPLDFLVIPLIYWFEIPGDDFMGQTWAPMVNAPPPAIPEIPESQEEKSRREGILEFPFRIFLKIPAYLIFF